LNVILNVVLPLATIGVVGLAVSVKSAAFVPEILTKGDPPVKYNAVLPVFCIMKVFVFVPLASLTLPKSVSSVTEGVVSPSTMVVVLP